MAYPVGNDSGCAKRADVPLHRGGRIFRRFDSGGAWWTSTRRFLSLAVVARHQMKKRSETPAWELPDSAVLPESQYLRRREFLRLFGYGLAASAVLPVTMRAASAGFPDSLNRSFKLDGVKLTPEDSITSYNNFYEWGFAKDEPKKRSNEGWKTEPWALEIGGLCKNPRKIDVNDLIKVVGGIERRNYRHRCVEAWSMVIPWDGFQLAKLVDLARPNPDANYVKFTSFFDPEHCSGQRSNDLP